MTIETDTIRGVTKNYGSRPTDMKWGGRADDGNLFKTATWTFDYDDLPGGATHNLGMVIPAGSTIKSAYLRIITAFTSTSTTTDLTIGLEQEDGSTAIDADGLITAAQATQTTIATVGNLIDGSSGTPGALIGTTIGATDGELVVAPSVDDLLTGRGEVIVEYITPAALPA